MLPFFPTMPGPWDGAARKGAYPSRFNLAQPFQKLDMLMLRGGTAFDQHQDEFKADFEEGHPWNVQYLLPFNYGPRAHGVEAMGAVAQSRHDLSQMMAAAAGFAPEPPQMPAAPAYPYAMPRVAEPSPYAIKELPYAPGVGVPFDLAYARQGLLQMPFTEGAMDPARDEMAAIATAVDDSIPSQPFQHMQYPWWYR